MLPCTSTHASPLSPHLARGKRHPRLQPASAVRIRLNRRCATGRRRGVCHWCSGERCETGCAVLVLCWGGGMRWVLAVLLVFSLLRCLARLRDGGGYRYPRPPSLPRSQGQPQPVFLFPSPQLPPHGYQRRVSLPFTQSARRRTVLYHQKEQNARLVRARQNFTHLLPSYLSAPPFLLSLRSSPPSFFCQAPTSTLLTPR